MRMDGPVFLHSGVLINIIFVGQVYLGSTLGEDLNDPVGRPAAATLIDLCRVADDAAAPAFEKLGRDGRVTCSDPVRGRYKNPQRAKPCRLPFCIPSLHSSKLGSVQNTKGLLRNRSSPLLTFVGMAGFEPAASRPPDVHSNRAELHPVSVRRSPYGRRRVSPAIERQKWGLVFSIADAKLRNLMFKNNPSPGKNPHGR